MSHRTSPPPHAQGARPAAGRQPGGLSKPGVAQPKAATPPQVKKQPVAPPVYRPQPATKAVQSKTVNAAPGRTPPAAPPAYRPQPAPKVLQGKGAAAQVPKQPKAPPVYRPEPKKLVQPKTAAPQSTGAPKAPPVYRPQPLPRVLQTKTSQPHAPSAVQSKPSGPRAAALAQARSNAGHQAAAPKAAPGRPAASGVVQPLIIRIRNVKEMVKIAHPTIMNASKDIKNDFLATDTKGREDVGITEATKEGARQLDQNEMLVVVAHAGEPTEGGLLSSGLPTHGGFKPADLAAKLAGLFPTNYSGCIYLDGCNTARRLNYNEGTSYIERFAAALSSARNDIQFTVKGNLGAASTASSGIEYIELSQSEAKLARAKGWTVHEVPKKDKEGGIKYVVQSPFGLAFCTHTGNYNDRGLSEQAKREAQEAAQRAELDKLVGQRIALSPTMTPQQQDQAWNDIL